MNNELVWRKSSRCDSGACVQVAPLAADAGVAMRDGKDPEAGTLVFSPTAWNDFIVAVRRGDFDL